MPFSIYKITNLITKKVYIGKTRYKIEKRFKEHLNSKNKTRISNSIQKYGKDNFICEQIDVASTTIELANKERYWIIYYNSIEKGYNTVLPDLIYDIRLYEYGITKPKNRHIYKSERHINKKRFAVLERINSLKQFHGYLTEYEMEYWHKLQSK